MCVCVCNFFIILLLLLLLLLIVKNYLNNLFLNVALKKKTFFFFADPAKVMSDVWGFFLPAWPSNLLGKKWFTCIQLVCLPVHPFMARVIDSVSLCSHEENNNVWGPSRIHL